MLNIKQCCGLGRCVVTKDLLDCKSCNGISYCGKEHQQEHFKAGHKLVSLIGDKYKLHKFLCRGCSFLFTIYYHIICTKVCKGRDKPLTFNCCVEKATKYYNEQMWVAALPYYSAILVRLYSVS